MNPSTIFPILLGIAALTFISVRQMSWRPVVMEKLFKMPMLLGIAGIVVIASSAGSYTSAHIGVLDVLILGLELFAALGGGWLMGRMTKIEVRGSVTRSRLSGAGLGVWLGFIATRIGFAVVGGFAGAESASLPALILFLVAIVKGVQALTIKDRLDRMTGRQDMHPERVLMGQH